MDRNLLVSLQVLFVVLITMGQAVAQDLRINNIRIEPITYTGDLDFSPTTHVYLTYDMLPGADLEFLNARFTNTTSGVTLWTVRNVPIPPLTNIQTVSFTMNVEGYEGVPYFFLLCEYDVGPEWVVDPTFPAGDAALLMPMPVINSLTSGSDDPALSFGPFIPPVLPPVPIPILPPGIHYRGCEVPNIDLDASMFHPPSSPIPTDINACGPAAAGNSLHWLVQQHPELAGDTSTLREKVDALKQLMRMKKNDPNGVRFDSMVVGKLSLIDALMLPISVKYQTKHTSGNTGKPLKSLDNRYGHIADNQGMLGKHPDFDWIKDEMDDGEDVEIHVGWYGPPDGTGDRPRTGGHWLVATGYVDTDSVKHLFLKDDDDQAAADPNALRHHVYRWDTLPDGRPFLHGLNDSQGRIGIVESAVSESYEPAVTFRDITRYDWSYKRIVYLSGSIQEGEDQHAWLTFNLPASPDFELLNARLCHPDTAIEVWLLQNIPLPAMTDSMPVRLKVDMGPLVVGDTLPDALIMKYHIGSEYQHLDTFYVQHYAEVQATSEPFLVPNGGSIGAHPLIPKFPALSISIPPLPLITQLLRGCEVPNIDLDSSMYMDDWNSCGPAATANSMQWLDDQHDEIDIPIEIRAILDSLKRMMHLDVESGVAWDDIVRAKLEFIDFYQLPIHVKYQAHRSAPAEIPSPNPLYGHKATNEGPPDPDNPGKFLHPTFDWLCQELEAGEDVEMMFGYYCDTTFMVGDTFPDGTTVTEITTKKQRKSGHVVNVTGKMTIGPLKWITYKHDVHQGDEGGTTNDNTPDSLRYTDFTEWVETVGGYAFLQRENYIEVDGDTCTTFVEAVFAESYDPDIDFCIAKVCIPDDDGEGSLRTALLCAEPGDTITLGPELVNDTIHLTSGPLMIQTDVVVRCDPNQQIYIKGDSVDRVFEIQSGTTVVFDGLRVICGSSMDAACVQNAGDATFRDVEFFSHDGGLLPAVQILNTGTLRIEGTTNLKE